MVIIKRARSTGPTPRTTFLKTRFWESKRPHPSGKLIIEVEGFAPHLNRWGSRRAVAVWTPKIRLGAKLLKGVGSLPGALLITPKSRPLNLIPIEPRNYSVSRHNVSWAEFGLPNRMLAGLLPGKRRNRACGRPEGRFRCFPGSSPT